MNWTNDRRFDQYLRHPAVNLRQSEGTIGLYDFFALHPRLIADRDMRYRQARFRDYRAMPRWNWETDRLPATCRAGGEGLP